MTCFRIPAPRAVAPILLAAGMALPVWSLAAPVQAQGLNCARASTSTERAICSTPALAALDARIAARYAALTDEFDADSAHALQQDQRAFLTARDTAAAPLNGTYLTDDLADRLVARADFLDSLHNDPLTDVVGRWRNQSGDINIVQWATGVVTFEGQTVDVPRQRWICDAAGNGELTGNGAARFEVTTDGSSNWSLTVQQKGAMLVVEEQAPAGAGAPPYCGANGTLAGVYFQAERAPDPSR